MQYDNSLFLGDNLAGMKFLKETIGESCFDLLYLDPPFFTQRTHHLLTSSPTPGKEGFSDRWTKKSACAFVNALESDEADFLQQVTSMFTPVLSLAELSYLNSVALRLRFCRLMLNDTGSIFLHCDSRMSHYLKIVCDIVFGKKCFRNEIVWKYLTGGAGKRGFANKHDILFWYSRHPSRYKFHPERVPELRSEKALLRAKNPRGARIAFDSPTKNPTDVWEIPALNPMARERCGYPTQKPESLLERILLACTDEGDRVGDIYCGSGTTCAVAKKLSRKWVGIDQSISAIKIAKARLTLAKVPVFIVSYNKSTNSPYLLDLTSGKKVAYSQSVK